MVMSPIRMTHRLLSPRLLLPLALLLALAVPFTLAVWWTHGIPSTASLLPALRIGSSSGTSNDIPVQNLESLGYTGAPGAVERFPANVPRPKEVPELRAGRWAGGWGVPNVNPGEQCRGHGIYKLKEADVVAETVEHDQHGSVGTSGQGEPDDEGEDEGEEEDEDENDIDHSTDATEKTIPKAENGGTTPSNSTVARRRDMIKRGKGFLGSLSPSSSSPSSHPSLALPHAAFLSLHFFSSTSHTTAPRARRDLIRRTIFTGVPPRLRRFVDVKFVLPHAWDPALGSMLDREEERYGDLIRIGGVNPNVHAQADGQGGDPERGVGVRWIEWVSQRAQEWGKQQMGDGKGGEVVQREGVWVVKCSDVVLPILPNLLPYLLAQNPSVPTYFGSSLLTDMKKPAYFERHMFGFTWGVLKTLTSAELTDEVKDSAEDIGLLFGELMYSLPSRPSAHSSPADDAAHSPDANISADPLNHPSQYKRQLHHAALADQSDPSNFISHAPTSPDPRTGLVYLDAGRLIAPFNSPYAAKGDEALGWYDVGDDFAYELDALAGSISDFRDKGRRYRWNAPPEMEDIVRACEGR